MSILAAHARKKRLQFIAFIAGCILLSYLLTVLWYKPALLFSPWEFLAALWSAYAGLWFASSYACLTWFVTHTLFILSCLWWFRCGELRTWFFTLLLGFSCSIWFGMLVYLAIAHPRFLRL